MESLYPKLALCGSKNLGARTDPVFFPTTEVSKGPVSLSQFVMFQIAQMKTNVFDTADMHKASPLCESLCVLSGFLTGKKTSHMKST